ncbi:hypothetical protein SBRY_40783 [Actinacidiphila bryophytorum]|uniref:Uncharacterized protein n=1 Tax=Actinacidiphila bryophytorum TaxID=1436133 RepID=A0A9W4H3M6_9ACTN|nr:hypothetical protein SBRY_40783 [Actinacidiphila bryophytorum]
MLGAAEGRREGVPAGRHQPQAVRRRQQRQCDEPLRHLPGRAGPRHLPDRRQLRHPRRRPGDAGVLPARPCGTAARAARGLGGGRFGLGRGYTRRLRRGPELARRQGHRGDAAQRRRTQHDRGRGRRRPHGGPAPGGVGHPAAPGLTVSGGGAPAPSPARLRPRRPGRPRGSCRRSSDTARGRRRW